MKNIESETVRLEMPSTAERLDSIRNLEGGVILERIVCDVCVTVVNPLNRNLPVNKRMIKFGQLTNTMLEPLCPVCGSFIPAEQFFHIEN